MVVIEPETEPCAAGILESEKAVASKNAEETTGGPGGEASGSSAGNEMISDEDVFEDALDEEQLEQRALAQANDMKEEGNVLYRAGNYEEALEKYRLALQFASEITSSLEVRSICHANRAVCYSKLGKYEDTTKECTKALDLNPSYLKALLRRGEAHEKLQHFDEAIADMKKIIELHPSDVQSRREAEKAIRRLEPLAAEKREKLKDEMIGKLKDLGNSVLGRFGMSVDNFKAVKDPNTGSYSVSFQR
ncbi:unnamed protein product [Spirodela intermedia]|uniref:Uncharacterized protein n=1 Tax=Spirodela intermedia TaxID=51605 RepID=A0A7I8KSR8_SPIIN|nr:unnamed protein product [Spirodela intermedia]